MKCIHVNKSMNSYRSVTHPHWRLCFFSTMCRRKKEVFRYYCGATFIGQLIVMVEISKGCLWELRQIFFYLLNKILPIGMCANLITSHGNSSISAGTPPTIRSCRATVYMSHAFFNCK